MAFFQHRKSLLLLFACLFFPQEAFMSEIMTRPVTLKAAIQESRAIVVARKTGERKQKIRGKLQDRNLEFEITVAQFSVTEVLRSPEEPSFSGTKISVYDPGEMQSSQIHALFAQGISESVVLSSYPAQVPFRTAPKGDSFVLLLSGPRMVPIGKAWNPWFISASLAPLDPKTHEPIWVLAYPDSLEPASKKDSIRKAIP
ncbi:MAG: hypothetical protein V1495_00120 [Pseudomonadota bacterium]